MAVDPLPMYTSPNILSVFPPLPPLFAALPEPFAAAYDPAAPWKLLDALDEILAALPSSQIDIHLSPDVHILGDRIVIGAGTRIHPGAVIEGPVWIGRDVEIRPGAYLRGGIWIGDGCVVGASTELKRAILFPGAKAPHLNYVGDSILGHKAHLGAGVKISNFKIVPGNVTVDMAGVPFDRLERLATSETTNIARGLIVGQNKVQRDDEKRLAASLERVAGPDVAKRIRWEPDARIERMVRGWPAAIDNSRAVAIGFAVDENFDSIVRRYVEEDMGVTVGEKRA